MIYFCADDYGLCEISSARIKKCVDEGILNKVSVFPNFDKIDLKSIAENKNIRISLHLNLVEGKCMADAGEINLLADENGNFRHTFGGLFRLNLLKPKKLENQLYKEIKAQVSYWKSILPQDMAFSIDSHQHTHMIPAVFKTLIKVLKDEKIDVEYIRVPAEPFALFVKSPSLYFTYSPVNIIKQWLLNFLWLFNRKYKVPTAYFFGILFSGNMDEKRVRKILPHYIKLAEKNKMDIEVLFHPGYLERNEADFKNKNVVFESFYFSENRKTEFNSAMKL